MRLKKLFSALLICTLVGTLVFATTVSALGLTLRVVPTSNGGQYQLEN